MTLAFQRNEHRSCSRCGKWLEDPASEERGVGPVCARKDTALFAKSIPANYAAATAILLNLRPDQLPEVCRARYEALWTNLLQRAEAVARANDDATVLQLRGQDLRPIIKEMDWLLSHRMEEVVRQRLVKVVGYLGYKELAAVLSQEASTTSATVWFHEGFVYLLGKSCKAGFLAMRQVPGIQVPRYGSNRPYSAPAAQAGRFLENVQNFWPFYVPSQPDGTPIVDGTLETVLGLAQAWMNRNEITRVPPEVPAATVQAPSVPQVPVAVMQMRAITEPEVGEWLEVSFPWLFDKTEALYEMIKKFKTIPKRQRKYDGNTRSWLFKPNHREAVAQAVSPLFTIQVRQ